MPVNEPQQVHAVLKVERCLSLSAYWQRVRPKCRTVAAAQKCGSCGRPRPIFRPIRNPDFMSALPAGMSSGLWHGGSPLLRTSLPVAANRVVLRLRAAWNLT
jgi:hypothetical protein